MIKKSEFLNEKLFESLPEEKRMKIINACIEEFGLNGYEKASTNAMVRKADISKGLLFYYFGNKKNLFMYMFNYSIEYLINKYFLIEDDQPADLFDRLIWISMVKIRMIYENPMMSRLVYNAITNMPHELKDDLTEKYNSIYNMHAPRILLEGIDTSKFRKDIDPERAIELVMMCLDGVAHKYIKMYSNRPTEELFGDLEKLVNEFNKYISILKRGICE